MSERIDRPAGEVYEYLRDPANLPQWAPGLGNAVQNVDGQWFVDSSMGQIRLEFAPRNEFGVLDHDVTLETGEVFHNPMRVIAYGGAACDVVFTLRRQPEMSDADFDRDAEAVATDLMLLKRILEA